MKNFFKKSQDSVIVASVENENEVKVELINEAVKPSLGFSVKKEF